MELGPENLLLLVPLLPLLGAIWNGAAGHRMPMKTVGIVGCIAPILSFCISLWAFFEVRATGEPLHQELYTWIASGSLSVPLAFGFDQLTAVMALVVSGVGSLIHVYSIGYMADDRSPARYFAFLNLFTFAMLTLVMADNLILMFVGWEGVGVCSYLLIGFWYEDMEKAIAGKKAFIVNRIGDFGFLLGFFVLFWTLHQGGHATVTFAGIREQIDVLAEAQFLVLGEPSNGLLSSIVHGLSLHDGWPVPAVVGILFFVGATGKSAQLPLYVWLPDAMAGPTPVSALIHAATMVTAGVYMVARLGFLYSLSPEAMSVVAIVGGLTALFAATIGLFQFDIKKVLAYSTVSQLGYMFIGVGVGAFHAGIFHLMTHAFFKALLFLAAGSVIVGLHHEQDIRKMGGLRKYMPITTWTFVIAWLAIIGVPGLSAFFSKDEILHLAHHWDAGGAESLAWVGPFVYVLGVCGAVLTAFYMTRLVVVTFFGECRLTEEEMHHLPHGKPVESPYWMTVPLIILAALSICGGWVGVPAELVGANHFESWLAPVVGGGHEVAAAAHGAAEAVHGAAAEASGAAAVAGHEAGAHGASVVPGMIIAICAMLLGAGVAWFLYSRKLPDLSSRSEEYLSGGGGAAGWAYRLVNAKYYVDELYDKIVVNPVRYGSRDYLWPFDKWVVDGAVNGAADVVKAVASILGFLQNGNVKRYLLAMAVGVVILVFLLTFGLPALAMVTGGGQ